MGQHRADLILVVMKSINNRIFFIIFFGPSRQQVIETSHQSLRAITKSWSGLQVCLQSKLRPIVPNYYKRQQQWRWGLAEKCVLLTALIVLITSARGYVFVPVCSFVCAFVCSCIHHSWVGRQAGCVRGGWHRPRAWFRHPPTFPPVLPRLSTVLVHSFDWQRYALSECPLVYYLCMKPLGLTKIIVGFRVSDRPSLNN